MCCSRWGHICKHESGTHETGRCDSCGEARSGNTRSRRKNSDKVIKGYAKFGGLFILAKAYPSSKCFWYP